MLHAAGKPYALQRIHSHFPPLIRSFSLIDQGELHILQNRQILDEVILLENKADLLVANGGKLLVRQLPNVHPAEAVLAPGRDIQAPQHVHHGGLTGAGLTHDGHELSPVNGEAHAIQGPDLAFQSFAVDLIYILDLDQHRYIQTSVVII